MKKATLWLAIVALSVVLPAAAQSPPEESLGTLARQLRQQRDEGAKKAAKVFTNDNLPAPTSWEPVNSQVGPPPPPENSTVASANSPKANSSAAPGESPKIGNHEPESPPAGVGTREYWQARFKAARQDVANAQKAQQLVEDELNLLQLQQAREIDPDAKAEFTTRVEAKQSEVDRAKAATEAAQKVLADIEDKFKESGAPEEWSQPEQQTDSPPPS